MGEGEWGEGIKKRVESREWRVERRKMSRASIDIPVELETATNKTLLSMVVDWEDKVD